MLRKAYLTVWLLALVLAACGSGGSDGDASDSAAPTPTPQPTLSFEERVEFAAGLAENPLRMVINPVDTIPQRIVTILQDELGLRRANAATAFSDVAEVEDGLTLLTAAVDRDFSVQLPQGSDEVFDTVSDLNRYVQEQVGLQVSADIFERTSLYVDVILLDGYGQALSDLCNSGTGIVSIPWLDGVTYFAANSQNCGQPALQVAIADGVNDFAPIEVMEETQSEATEEAAEATEEIEATAETTTEAGDGEAGDGDEQDSEPDPTATPEPTDVPDEPEILDVDELDLRVGDAGVLVTSPELGASQVSLISERVFCRLGVEDFYSWLLPTLVLEQSFLDPVRSPSAIEDYASVDDLVEAVVDRDCAMTGMSRRTFDSLDNQEDLLVVEETVAFPFAVLMYPLEVQLGVRLSLNENLAALASDPEDGRTLRLLLGQSALLPAVPDDFVAVSAFMEATGYDFATLGD